MLLYKISIIIPVYQAKRYLEKCIKGVCNQTYDNIEILLIDDGSTDDSGTICDVEALKDSRIRVVHQANSGVSAARNKGLDIAAGDYVLFVDADDYIAPQLCENLLQAMAENPAADLVISGFIEDFGTKQKPVSLGYKKQVGFKELQKEFDLYYKIPLLNAPFSKLYKKELLCDIRFERKVSMGEDFLFNLKYYMKCEQIIFLPDTDYFYNQTNVDSATKKYKSEYFECYKECYRAGKQFKYDSIHFDNDALDEALCSNCLGILQIICYQKAKWSWKRKRLSYICNDELFRLVSKGKYSFSLKKKIPQWLCKKRLYGFLNCFFIVKRIFKRKILNKTS